MTSELLRHYPLLQVIDVKKRRVEEAEALVAQREQELEREREKLRLAEAARDKVAQHLQDKVVQLRQILDEGTTSDKIQLSKNYIKVVQERLAAEEKKVKKQQDAVEVAKQNLLMAKEELKQRRVDLEKIETHRDMWLKEQLLELEKEEAKEQDEIGQIMYLKFLRDGQS